MRWLVEVGSLSSGSPAERISFDAPTWQAALSQARAMRGDTGTLADFTIEVLADGYRATNAMARVRFTVHRHPDDTPSSLGGIAVARGSAGPQSDSAARRSSPPMASTSGGGAARPLSTPAPSPVSPVGKPPSTASSAGGSSGASRPTASGASAVVEAPGATPFPAHRDASGVLPILSALPGRLLYRRSEDPDARSPLTYRELAIALESDKSGAADVQQRAADVARAHFADVKQELERHRAPVGQLVRIAVFDHAWSDRPSRPPLTTLIWKDWQKEDAKIVDGTVATALPAAVNASSRPPQAAVNPDATAKSIPSARASASLPSSVSASPVAAPLVSTTVPSAPPSSSKRAGSAPPSSDGAGPPSSSGRSSQTPRISARLRSRTPIPGGALAGSPPRSLRPDDLMTEIFEAVHDLHFMSDALEGAEFILGLLEEKVPTHTAFVHLYDINAKEFVVVKARAPNLSVIGCRVGEAWGAIGIAVNRGTTIFLKDADADKRWDRTRYERAGYKPKTILIVPVRQGRRYLGAIELADHVDGAALSDDEIYAVTYIAEQYAEFVAERGIVLSADSTSALPVVTPKTKA